VLLISALLLQAVANSLFNLKSSHRVFARGKGQIREVKSLKLRKI
jgi:hypothetical protein